MIPNQSFTVAAGQSEAVKFPIAVPYQFNKALVWRIVAKADDCLVMAKKMQCLYYQPHAGNRNLAFTDERNRNKKFQV